MPRGQSEQVGAVCPPQRTVVVALEKPGKAVLLYTPFFFLLDGVIFVCRLLPGWLLSSFIRSTAGVGIRFFLKEESLT